MPVRTEANILGHSTEVLEVMAHKPSWIVRNGILILIGIALMAAALVYLKYPEIINEVFSQSQVK